MATMRRSLLMIANKLSQNAHGRIVAGKIARALRFLRETSATPAETFAHAFVRMSHAHAPHVVASLPVHRESS